MAGESNAEPSDPSNKPTESAKSGSVGKNITLFAACATVFGGGCAVVAAYWDAQ